MPDSEAYQLASFKANSNVSHINANFSTQHNDSYDISAVVFATTNEQEKTSSLLVCLSKKV